MGKMDIVKTPILGLKKFVNSKLLIDSSIWNETMNQLDAAVGEGDGGGNNDILFKLITLPDITNTSLAANVSTSIVINLPENSGYTPIAIVNMLPSKTTIGLAWVNIVDDTKAVIGVKNMLSSSSGEFTIKLKILYVKTANLEVE